MEFINKISQAIKDQVQSKSSWANHLVVIMSFIVIATGYLVYNTIQTKTVNAQSPSGINIIFPENGSSLEIGLPINIEWNCGLAGVYNYSLYYSENKGIDWNLIDDTILHINTPNHQEYKDWIVPVVNNPGEANFRMKVEAYSSGGKLLGSSLAEKIEEIPTTSLSLANPKINGSLIVYQDGQFEGLDPTIYNIDTDTIFQIPSSLMASTGQDVFGPDVAWLESSPGTENPQDLHLYNLNTSNYIQVTSDGLARASVSLGDDIVTWQSKREFSSEDTDIYIQEISTQIIKNITLAGPGGELFRYQPKIDGDKIVWWDNRNGPWDIYMYTIQDINNGVTTRITTDSSSQVSPDISGNRIVYQDNRNAYTGSGWDIYMYDLVSQEETRITTNDANQTAPIIDGNIIAWSDDRNGGEDIYIYDIETKASTRISIGDTVVSTMDIDNNRIVWQGENSGITNISLYEVSAPQLFTISYAQPDGFEFIVPNQANSGEDFEITATALKGGIPLTTFDGVITMNATPNQIIPDEINIWNNGVSTEMYQIISDATTDHDIVMFYHGASIGSYSIEIITSSDNHGLFPGIQNDTEWFFGEVDKPMRTEGIIPSNPNQSLPVSFYACLESNGGTGGDWYSAGGTWNYRQEITIDGSKIPSVQSNFPILIKLDSTSNNLLFEQAMANGYDILFTDNDKLTKLDHEIERYDNTAGNEYLEAYVKIPTLSSDTVIYVYYGNSTSANQENAIDAWSNDYRLVYHLDDLTTTTVKDSTGTNNGTKTAVDEPAEITGKIGQAQGYDGINDYIDTNDDHDYSGNGAFSIFHWTKDTLGEDSEYLISQTHEVGSYKSDWILGYANGGLWFRDKVVNGDNKINDGEWHQHGFVFNGTTAQLYIDGKPYGSSVTPTEYGGINSIKLMTRGDAAVPMYIGKQDEVRFSTVNRSDHWIEIAYNNQNSPSTFLNFGDEETDASECFSEPILTDFYINTDEVGLFTTHPSYPEWEKVGYLNDVKIEDDLENNIFIRAIVGLGGGEQFIYQSNTFSIVEADVEVRSIILDIHEERTAIDMPFTITVSVFSDLAGNNPIYNFNETLTFSVIGLGGDLNPTDIGNSSPFSGTWSNGSVMYDGYTLSAAGNYSLKIDHNGVSATDDISVDENAVYIDSPTADTVWYEGGNEHIAYRAGGVTSIDHFKIFYSETVDINDDKLWIPLDSYYSYDDYISCLQTWYWEDIDIPGALPQNDIAIKVESYETSEPDSFIASGVSDDFIVDTSGEKSGTYTSKIIDIDENNPDVYITEITGFTTDIGYDYDDGGTPPSGPDEADIQIFIKVTDGDEEALYTGDGWYKYEPGADLDFIFAGCIEEIRKVQFKIHMSTYEIAIYQPWVKELKLDYIAETLEDQYVGMLNFVEGPDPHKSVERPGSVGYEIVFNPRDDYKGTGYIPLTIQLELNLPGNPVGIGITASPDPLIVLDGSDSYSRTITLTAEETAEIANGIPFTIGAIVLEHPDLIVENIPLNGTLDVTESGADDDFLISISGDSDKEIIPGGIVLFNISVSFDGNFNESITLSSDIESKFDTGVIKSVEFIPPTVTPPGDKIIEMKVTIEDNSGEHPKTEFDITGIPEQADIKTISPKPSLAISDSALEDINIEAVAEVEGGISSDRQYPTFSFRLYQEDITDPSDSTIDIDSLIADSVAGDEVTISIKISPNDVVDGETYIGYLRSTRHLWRKATTPIDGKITIDLSGLEYNLEFPKLLAGDISGTSDDDANRDNAVNVMDWSRFAVDFYKSMAGLLPDFNNDEIVNLLDQSFIFSNFYENGELPGN